MPAAGLRPELWDGHAAQRLVAVIAGGPHRAARHSACDWCHIDQMRFARGSSRTHWGANLGASWGAGLFGYRTLRVVQPSLARRTPPTTTSAFSQRL